MDITTLMYLTNVYLLVLEHVGHTHTILHTTIDVCHTLDTVELASLGISDTRDVCQEFAFVQMASGIRMEDVVEFDIHDDVALGLEEIILDNVSAPDNIDQPVDMVFTEDLMDNVSRIEDLSLAVAA